MVHLDLKVCQVDESCSVREGGDIENIFNGRNDWNTIEIVSPYVCNLGELTHVFAPI